MGVANVIEFGGVSSNDYDVVIEGPGEYTAPKRAYESIEIPGRNGSFILDKGHFENVDGKFKAVIKAETQIEFQKKVRDFKNAIVSQRGYQRLTELYHPDSYRMAAYKGGFDEEPEFIGKAAIFTLVFDCMPQRYLMSGESAIDVTNGETILNPTLFEAKPLIEVEGYGNISFNGYEIDIENALVGEIELLPAVVEYKGSIDRRSYSESLVNLINDGDTMTLPSFTAKVTLKPSGIQSTPWDRLNITSVSRTSENIPNFISSERGTALSDKHPVWVLTYGEQTFVKGEGDSQGVAGYEDTFVFHLDVYRNNSKIGEGTATSTLSVKNRNDGDINWLKIGFGTFTISSSLNRYMTSISGAIPTLTAPAFTAMSTQSALGNPTYIDCDIGGAYKLIDGTPSSLNAYIDLGSELPQLAPGTNTFTYDNTVTDLKITPRWWKV